LSFNGDLYSTDEGLELTTKGQIHTHNASSNVGLGVSGNNDYVLVEDSTTATGLAWKVNAHASGGSQIKLYDNTLTVNGSGTVFELDSSADPLTATDYSYFNCWLTGTTDGTNPYTTTLNFIIDRSTANTYYQNGQYVNATGVQTWDSSFPATTGELADGTILDSDNCLFACHIVGGFNPVQTKDFNLFSKLFQYSNGYNAWKQIDGWSVLTTANEISYIGIGVGTNDLQAGSRFTIFGNKVT